MTKVFIGGLAVCIAAAPCQKNEKHSDHENSVAEGITAPCAQIIAAFNNNNEPAR
jgi:hypothetical protein